MKNMSHSIIIKIHVSKVVFKNLTLLLNLHHGLCAIFFLMMNTLHRIRHLKTWSPVGDTISGGLGNAALLEEIFQWSTESCL